MLVAEISSNEPQSQQVGEDVSVVHDVMTSLAQY
jgi:hypothetical protein